MDRTLALLLSFTLLAAGCGPASEEAGSERTRVGFVTNSSSDFWAVARAGIRKAEREFKVDVDFQVPGRGTAAEQRQIIETLIAKGVQGMAVSVLDPKGSVGILDEAAKHMPVVTQDSDCPDSSRIAYIGTDNLEAGRKAGTALVRALPKGGQVALFVGKLDVANARERKQGIEEAIADSGVEIVEVFTDEVQRSTAQSNVRNALDKYPRLAALVGLWSYNTPAIVKVVREKDLAGKITVIGFDEESETLEAVADGVVSATIVQQPFEFGYRSVRALALLARGEDPGLPADGLSFVPVRVVDRDNVDAFRRDLARQLAEGSDA